MDLKQLFGERIKSFDDFLRSYISRIDSPFLKEGIEYALFGDCKRFRPLLVFASYELFASDTSINSIKKTFPFAAAVEMVHTYSLIHDDLPSMDNADMRRGKPSVHKKFGEGIAVLLGDGLLTEAFRAFSIDDIWDGVSRAKRLVLSGILASAIGFEGMVEGQAMDILYGKIKSPVEKIAEKKTAMLISASCEGGGYISGGKRGKNLMRRFGLLLGRVFQIIDDIKDHLSGEKRKDEPSFVEVFGMQRAKEIALELLKKGEEMVSGCRNRDSIMNLIKFLRDEGI